MKRIDENTYIDDTLVTCAEYQLFIDEKRKHGYSYQPDHWSSYQFPKGKAGEPILGVRYSDAIAFCEWLSDRENVNWRFKLPSDLDIIKDRLKDFHHSLFLGYWIDSSSDDTRFEWITNIPSTPSLIETNLSADFHYIQKLELNLKKAYEVSLKLERERARNLDQVFGKDRNRALDYLGVERQHARSHNDFNIARKQVVLSIDRNFDRVPALVRENAYYKILHKSNSHNPIFYRAANIHGDKVDKDFIPDKFGVLGSKFDQDLNLDYIQDRNLEINHARALVREFILDQAINLEFDIDLELERASVRGIVFDIENSIKSADDGNIETLIDLYLDLFKLQERIAGRSPAFEGIRLVKERIN